jgi:glucan phosphoethanolaminetransferase (alkaline phosphatase superfamily)
VHSQGLQAQVIPDRAAPALLVLCAPLIALAIWLVRANGLQSLAGFLASILLPILLVGLCTKSWRSFFLVQLPVVLLGAAFATCTITYDTIPGDLLAYVLATSSWDEIRGFFTVWQGQRLLVAGAALAGIYVAAALWVPREPIFDTNTRRMRLGLLGVVCILIAFAATRPAALIEGLAGNPVIGTAFFISGPLAHARAAVNGNAVKKTPFGASRNPSEEVHILVIGESARRDSWSVYGYERKTTPYLEKLRDEAIFFKDAVADANFTVYAVPILLTGMSPGHFDMAHIQGNIVDLAKEGGYSTAWLMNQDPHISLLTGVHAEHMVFPPPISTLIIGHLPLDESLLPELRREIARAGRARFIGVHIIGSHWEYASRYPPAFERFGSAKGLTFASVFSQKSDPRLLSAYDNSLAYTDWFLEQIIEQARKLTVPATVTYFSDHGEDLYSLDGSVGHGTTTYTRHQFDIPAFVWTNSAYREAHPERMRAIADNADKTIRTHNVFYSMADLMGIRWPGARPSESFASPDFAADLASPYIAGGTLVTRPN